MPTWFMCIENCWRGKWVKIGNKLLITNTEICIGY